MSDIHYVIQERTARIGKSIVGRLLPFRAKRMIGPFIYMDHMGPELFDEDENFDVGPHPHIGLSTLTYLLEGSILHRDTLGNAIEIKPGEVNWMTAGKGIVHSERTPDYLRNQKKKMHGLQIWIALPKELEQMEAAFFHAGKESLPHWNIGDISFKLIAGEAFGRKSPVPVYSKLFFIEVKSQTNQTLSIANELFGETGIYILDGSIEAEDKIFETGQLVVSKDSKLSEIIITAGSTVFLLGGEPFPEERFIDWNFVSSSRALLEEARQRWIAQEFGQLPGENDFIPLPGLKPEN
ncbi:MAG: pirin family protein [Bacteroidetes bacterium]|nr:pirin family protein [Bacteroidota bacterium]